MLIELKNVSHIYMKDTPLQQVAIENLSLAIDEGEFVGIIGRTGSGKSTLIQHFNGLLRPDSGQVLIDGEDIWANKSDLRKVRRKIGLVFQYPEHQMFEETVMAEIAFGPKNVGVGEDEMENVVRRAMETVNLNFEELKDRSPFELSGGQKRKVAIASVVAMSPKVLVLDEPTAGMDPKGREEVLGNIKKLHDEDGYTIILVSHSMEEVAQYANRLIVIDDGEIAMDGSPRETFGKQSEKLQKLGLGIPQVTELMNAICSRGFEVDRDVITVKEAKEALLKAIAKASDSPVSRVKAGDGDDSFGGVDQ